MRWKQSERYGWFLLRQSSSAKAMEDGGFGGQAVTQPRFTATRQNTRQCQDAPDAPKSFKLFLQENGGLDIFPVPFDRNCMVAGLGLIIFLR
jgi:hypothetical protein